MTDARIVTLGDACLSVEFEARIAPDVNARCVALAAALEARGLAGVRDVVAGYHTVAVYFDPLKVARPRLQAELETGVAQIKAQVSSDQSSPIQIPVSYGGADGPDLGPVAAFAGCSEDEVIRLHAAPIYRVYMLGFLPGFAYLGTVDRRIAMPRLETPRVKVAAGSIGIAGAQTGIYPSESPGGWRIIGRTSAKTFDAAREQPSLLKAGDRVQFVAV